MLQAAYRTVGGTTTTASEHPTPAPQCAQNYHQTET